MRIGVLFFKKLIHYTLCNNKFLAFVLSSRTTVEFWCSEQASLFCYFKIVCLVMSEMHC